MDESYLSTIFIWSSTFAPMNFAYCDGTILNVSVNSALFSLLSYNFGGNGSTTFGLPDLRGRVPVGTGIATSNTSARTLGQTGGVETVALTSTQIPAHTHDLCASTTAGTSNTPSATMAIATPPNISQGSINKPVNMYAAPTAGTMTTLVPGSIGVNSGGGQAHNNMMPFLGLSYIICTQGLYPVRP
jgi:microcystin-dependent protein